MTKEEVEARLNEAFRKNAGKPRGLPHPVSKEEQQQRVARSAEVLRQCAVNYAKERKEEQQQRVARSAEVLRQCAVNYAKELEKLQRMP